MEKMKQQVAQLLRGSWPAGEGLSCRKGRQQENSSQAESRVPCQGKRRQSPVVGGRRGSRGRGPESAQRPDGAEADEPRQPPGSSVPSLASTATLSCSPRTVLLPAVTGGTSPSPTAHTHTEPNRAGSRTGWTVAQRAGGLAAWLEKRAGGRAGGLAGGQQAPAHHRLITMTLTPKAQSRGQHCHIPTPAPKSCPAPEPTLHHSQLSLRWVQGPIPAPHRSLGTS